MGRAELGRVRITLDAGAPGGGFVLLPTAMPVDVPLPDAKAQNVETYLRAGRKYGHKSNDEGNNDELTERAGECLAFFF